jgi:hypothetical protein
MLFWRKHFKQISDSLPNLQCLSIRLIFVMVGLRWALAWSFSLKHAGPYRADLSWVTFVQWIQNGKGRYTVMQLSQHGLAKMAPPQDLFERAWWCTITRNKGLASFSQASPSGLFPLLIYITITTCYSQIPYNWTLAHLVSFILR